MSNIPIRAAEHPEHVWEAKRQLFTQLYKEEKMKLSEVQRHMHKEHGFYATERQYKRKIKKWKLEKNSKADEKTHALALLQGSKTRLDLASVYNFNGKDIAAHKLLRHARSRGVEPPDIVSKAVDRRCHSSLSRIERVARSQDSELCSRSEPMEILLRNLYEVLESFPSVILSGGNIFLALLISAQSPIFTQWLSTKSTDHFTAVLLSAKRLLEFVYRLKHLQSQKRRATGRESSELVLVLQKLASEYQCFIEAITTTKTWEGWFQIPVDRINVLPSGIVLVLIDRHTAYSKAYTSLLDNFSELWNILRRWPLEAPRVIEIPEKSVNHQREVQSEALDIEMQDLDYTDTSTITPHSSRIIQGFEISDNSDPAENKPPDSGIHFHNHLNAGDLLSNRFEIPRVAARSSSDCASELQDNETSQNIHNIASMEIDNYAFGLSTQLLAGVPPSPPFPSILIMELPSPLVLSDEYMQLTQGSFDSSEIQEGPIPDLEILLDSSLWENSCNMAQFDQNPDSSFELISEGDTSPPPAGVQKRLQ